jgi:hypothetical protein
MAGGYGFAEFAFCGERREIVIGIYAMTVVCAMPPPGGGGGLNRYTPFMSSHFRGTETAESVSFY